VSKVSPPPQFGGVKESLQEARMGQISQDAPHSFVLVASGVF